MARLPKPLLHPGYKIPSGSRLEAERKGLPSLLRGMWKGSTTRALCSQTCILESGRRSTRRPEAPHFTNGTKSLPRFSPISTEALDLCYDPVRADATEKKIRRKLLLDFEDALLTALQKETLAKGTIMVPNAAVPPHTSRLADLPGMAHAPQLWSVARKNIWRSSGCRGSISADGLDKNPLPTEKLIRFACSNGSWRAKPIKQRRRLWLQHSRR